MKKKKNELLKLVELILTAFKATRDNDMDLIARVWFAETKYIDVLSATDFLIRVAKSEVSSPESIRRRRQLLQAKYPELRGTKYEERRVYSKKYKEHVIKGEINELA
jgi:hypothetical protein